MDVRAGFMRYAPLFQKRVVFHEGNSVFDTKPRNGNPERYVEQ